MSIRITAAAVAMSVLPAIAPAATLIDFEGLAPVGSFSQLGTAFETQGFRFTATSGDMLAYGPGGVASVPESGSTSISMSNNPNRPPPVSSSLTFAAVDGSAFTLHALRAAEGRNRGQFFANFASTAIEIVGNFANGGAITRLFTFDGIAGDNGATDFESISFDGFVNLASVTITGQGGNRGGYSFSLDDIEVSAVPLPGAMVLLLAGLGGLAAAGRRRRA